MSCSSESAPTYPVLIWGSEGPSRATVVDGGREWKMTAWGVKDGLRIRREGGDVFVRKEGWMARRTGFVEWMGVIGKEYAEGGELQLVGAGSFVS